MRKRGQPGERPRRTAQPKFLSLDGAYHGDTIGAVSLGHIDLFHKAYAGLLFKTDKVMSPYCYRCPFNRAKPERADAREYRKCNWECVGQVEQKFSAQKKKGNPYAAFVFEPLMQGAAGMIPQPEGWLRRVAGNRPRPRRAADCGRSDDGVWTNGAEARRVTKAAQAQWPSTLDSRPSTFVCLPSRKCAAGFSLPGQRFDRRLSADGGDADDAESFRCVSRRIRGVQNLFSRPQLHRQPTWRGGGAGEPGNFAKRTIHSCARRSWKTFCAKNCKSLWSLPNVGDIRQVGLIAGIELVKNWRTREPFDLRERAGIRVCEAMARRGVLTRPIGNVIVLMPPYCTTPAQLRKMVAALRDGVKATLRG